MAEEAVKVDPDAIGHKAFHEDAKAYGDAFEGGHFEPGVTATESGRDYNEAKSDAARDVFEGRGYDEDTAKGVDDKFEKYMTDRAEMENQVGGLGARDGAPEMMEDNMENKDG